MKDVLLVLLGAAVVGLGTQLLRLEIARRRRARARPERRILFPITATGPSDPALEATLRLARAERATLVPAFLASVPLVLPIDAAIPRQAATAMPLLDGIELRAARAGVPTDSRIERGRTLRHALKELLAHERHDRVVVAAGHEAGGLDAADIAWLLEHADAEVVALRPRRLDGDPVPSSVLSRANREPLTRS